MGMNFPITEALKVQVLEDYHLAYLARKTDEAQIAFFRQGKAPFFLTGAGHELVQVAAARELHPGDWVRGYYRTTAIALAVGFSVRHVLAQVLGDADGLHDPSSGGRMMGGHLGSRLLDDQGVLRDLTTQVNYASDNLPTGSQMPVALGLARASKVFQEVPSLSSLSALSQSGEEVAFVQIG